MTFPLDPRAIDALIAEHLFNWRKRTGHEDRWVSFQTGSSASLPYYSSCIQDAWMVVEEMKQIYADQMDLLWGAYGESHIPKIGGQIMYPGKLGWFVRVYKGENMCSVFYEQAPMAVCLAALKALGVSYEY